MYPVNRQQGYKRIWDQMQKRQKKNNRICQSHLPDNTYKKEEKQKAKVHKEMKHLLETDPEFCTTMDKLNELKKKRERYKKEKEELNERRKNAGMELDFCSAV